jgi:hypothetical protein
MDVATRLIDSITDRVSLLASFRIWGVPAMKISALAAAALRSFSVVSRSSRVFSTA